MGNLHNYSSKTRYSTKLHYKYVWKKEKQNKKNKKYLELTTKKYVQSKYKHEEGRKKSYRIKSNERFDHG